MNGEFTEDSNTSEPHEEELASAHRNGEEAHKFTNLSRLLWVGVEARRFCTSRLLPLKHLS